MGAIVIIVMVSMVRVIVMLVVVAKQRSTEHTSGHH